MRETPGGGMDTHPAESDLVDEKAENTLRETLLAELPGASSLEDLAKIKKEALGKFDLGSPPLTEIDQAIVRRFQELLNGKVHEIL